MKKFLIFILIFAWMSSLLAAEEGIQLSDIRVLCAPSTNCISFTEKFSEMRRSFSSRKDIEDEIRAILYDAPVKKFSWILEETVKGIVLKANIDFKMAISSIAIEGSGLPDLAGVLNVIPCRAGELFDEKNVAVCQQSIRRYVVEKGYLSTAVTTTLIPEGEDVILQFKIDAGSPSLVESFDIEAPSEFAREIVRKQLSPLRRRPLDRIYLSNLVSKINLDLVDEGYLFAKVEIPGSLNFGKRGVILPVKVVIGDKYFFGFEGNTIIGHQELIEALKVRIKKFSTEVDAEDLRQSIVDIYESKGLYDTTVTVSRTESAYIPGVKAITFRFHIGEGAKIPVVGIEFAGNKSFTSEKLLSLFKERASILADRGYLDRNFLKEFSAILREFYLSNGFIFVKISPASVNLQKKERKDVAVFYRVDEGVRCEIDKIVLKGIPDNSRNDYLSQMKNQEGFPLNVPALTEDLGVLLETARQKGHYYATIRNQSSSELVTYSSSFRKATIVVDMDAGEEIRFGRTVISGLQKTKSTVIHREISLVKGDIITPEIVADITERLRQLGLFSLVEVTPVIDESVTGRSNILVSVKEQNAGVIETAPGFRSDIGLKLSTGVSYNNLGGRNRRAAFKGQVNQRLDWDAFDPRRVAEHKRMVEFMAQVSYHEPYFLGKPLSMDHSFSSNRKRFRSFDAVINQYELTFGKDLTKHLSTSLRYQMEIIEQFDATYDEDRGYFRIGGFTPSLSLDFRDNIFNPMKGTFFNLSWEVANKLFFSMSKPGKEIDYHRLVSRNQFYAPLSTKTVLAMSVAFGMEKNLARRPWMKDDGTQVFNANGEPSTNGFIPGIKVFRLNGADTVRGFSDEEINRLGNGRDISSVVIQDSAYFTSIKIEPRYLIDDTTMLGVFLDAGRLYVNKWDDLSLRSSVGVTFKYLTPVGSINFDYGFKLWRRHMPDGTLEDPGRFHLSIGFF